MSGRIRLDPEERRRQILAAATSAFRDESYAEVSLEDLAHQAGVTRGLLHHYFGSKRALYLAVLEQAATVPPAITLIPPGMRGELAEVIGPCVERWLRMIEAADGLWSGMTGLAGVTDGDVIAVLTRARDALVDRMIDELPFPDDLDPALLRTALNAYASSVRVVTDEWLVVGCIGRPQVAAFLESSLLSVVDSVVPAMGRAPR